MTLVRTQILLEEEQRRRLLRAAKKQGKSLSELIRESVAQYLDEQRRAEDEQFMQTLERWRQVREKLPLYEGDLIEEGREERMREMEDMWEQSS